MEYVYNVKEGVNSLMCFDHQDVSLFGFLGKWTLHVGAYPGHHDSPHASPCHHPHVNHILCEDFDLIPSTTPTSSEADYEISRLDFAQLFGRMASLSRLLDPECHIQL
jgi:hypothetical protein